MSEEKKGSFKGRGKAEESWGYSDEERKRRERKQSSIRSRLQARQHLQNKFHSVSPPCFCPTKRKKAEQQNKNDATKRKSLFM